MPTSDTPTSTPVAHLEEAENGALCALQSLRAQAGLLPEEEQRGPLGTGVQQALVLAEQLHAHLQALRSHARQA